MHNVSFLAQSLRRRGREAISCRLSLQGDMFKKFPVLYCEAHKEIEPLTKDQISVSNKRIPSYYKLFLFYHIIIFVM